MPDQQIAFPPELLQFLRSQIVASLATLKDGKAHATTVFFYVEDDYRFYFLTREESPKFSYISKNPSVGLVITDPATLQTVQVEGNAVEVDYSKTYQATMKKYIDAVEKHIKWANFPINHIFDSGYYTFVQVTPTWIRWTDFTNWNHTVKFEHRFA